MFFALDHTHYAKWLSVFVQDLETLIEKNPKLYSHFNEGKFSMSTSNLRISQK